MARTKYIRCIHGILSRENTKYTVVYSLYIGFWPILFLMRGCCSILSTHPIPLTQGPFHIKQSSSQPKPDAQSLESLTLILQRSVHLLPCISQLSVICSHVVESLLSFLDLCNTPKIKSLAGCLVGSQSRDPCDLVSGRALSTHDMPDLPDLPGVCVHACTLCVCWCV